MKSPATLSLENEMMARTYMAQDKFPPKENLPANSTHRLGRLELVKAINDVKRFVEERLERDLNVIKHPAPLGFLKGTGVNDELDGTESKSAVTFTVPNKDIPRGIMQVEEEQQPGAGAGIESCYEMQCEIVQSLAKWKRIMLDWLNVNVGQGIYCDSTSIRKGYKGDVTHSVVADQWDFEIRIDKEQRTLETLKSYVKIIWKIITDAEDYILERYPQILPSPDAINHHPISSAAAVATTSRRRRRLPKEITFLTSQELHDTWPTLDVHDRENAAVAKYGAIFIIGMGWPMSDGSPAEEQRSPGYDDWNLNGDIIVQHPLTQYCHELSSMGIRVDRDSLWNQLKHKKGTTTILQEDIDKLDDYQKAIMNETIPFSYGGGIGISRLLMLLLRTCHIGQVQVGLWHDAHYQQAMENGIDLIPDRIIHSK